MALVSQMRKAASGEPGDTFVKVMIRRKEEEIWSHLYLQHILGDCYQVVGGDAEAIMLFGDGREDDRVYIKPIANQDFSHLVTQ